MPEDGAERGGGPPLLQELHQHPGLQTAILRLLHGRTVLHTAQNQDGRGGVSVRQQQNHQEARHGDPDLRLPQPLPPGQRCVAAVTAGIHQSIGHTATQAL